MVQDSAIQPGLAEMQDSFRRSELNNDYFNLPYFLWLLAQAYALDGQMERALKVVERANRVGDEQGDWLWKAEILRFTGELRLRLSQDEQEAEKLFHAALDLARQQHAKSLELRTATSLARLWQHQGKYMDAHSLLLSVYDWFTEGFDTPDLQAAKALLDELQKQASP